MEVESRERAPQTAEMCHIVDTECEEEHVKETWHKAISIWFLQPKTLLESHNELSKGFSAQKGEEGRTT